MTKYVAFKSVRGYCMGFTTLAKFEAAKERGFLMIEPDESLVEFEADDYDESDEMFARLKIMAAEAVAKEKA
jgi:hypothetical protein